MATVTRTTIWSDNQVLTAAALNGEFNNLLNGLNLVNADISASAAIASSKISFGGSNGNVLVSNGSGGLTYATSTGTGNVVFATSPTITTPTLTKPVIDGSTQALTTDTDGATVTFDMSASSIHSVTLGGNRTLALANVAIGDCFVLRLIQDGSGSRTVTWFSTIHWVTGSAPTLTTTASHWDTLGFICTASNVFDGYIIGQNLS